MNIPSIDNLYALSQMFQVPMDALIVGNGIRYIDFGSGIYKQRSYLLMYFRCMAGAGIG